MSLNFKSGTPVLSKTSQARASNWGNASVSDTSGNPLFYAIDDTIYNHLNEPMPNGYSTTWSTANDNQVLILPKSKTQYYVFRNLIHPDSSYFVYSIVDMRLDNGRGDIVSGKKDIPVYKATAIWYKNSPLSPVLLNAAIVKNKSDFSFWILTAYGDSMLAFPLDSNGIKKPIKNFYRQYDSSYNYSVPSNIYPSHDGKFLLSLKTITLAQSYVFAYDFNLTTGVITNQRLVTKIDSIDFPGRHFINAAFSPNDSFFYVSKFDTREENNGTYQCITQYERYSSDIAHTNVPLVSNAKYMRILENGTKGDFWLTMKTAPDGKIYYIGQPLHTKDPATKKDTTDPYYNYLGVIEYPNKKGTACTILRNGFNLGTDVNLPGHYPHNFPKTVDIQFTAGFQAQTGCSVLKLTETSDSVLSRHQWWIQKIGGTHKDSGAGKQTTFQVPVSGRYRVAYRGANKVDYPKWHYDTITVTVPPHAKGKIIKDTICRYTATPFYNLSQSDTVNPATGKKYLWYFGDGKTDTATNPTHAFTDTGTFTVSIVYNNGFCKDSFVFPKPVYVQDAPAPGFTTNALWGCAPFAVTIKNKATGLVKAYTYTFGDGATDTIAEPHHTYRIPGTYTITQSLLADGGCITSNSFPITVVKGLDSGSTTDVARASVKAGNQIEVIWHAVPYAVKYMLLRQADNETTETPIVTLATTSYIDANVSTSLHSYRYHIQAIDTCGNISAEGRPGTTILLGGINDNNIDAQLSWNIYTQWQEGVHHYIVEKEDANGSFSPVAQVNSGTQYIDPGFAEPNVLQKCYRVSAWGSTSEHYSHSNIFCLKYKPNFYIPNAFTPTGDSLNEVYQPVTIGITSYTLFIFNRWGELVYEGGAGWDGTVKGGPALPGVYLYRITAIGITGEYMYKKGTFELIR